MGMSDNMLACIRAIAENRIQDAKQYAICCCVEDGTKKNEGKVQYYKKLLENEEKLIISVKKQSDDNKDKQIKTLNIPKATSK